MAQDTEGKKPRRDEYHAPKVVHVEKLSGHAVSCNMADDSCGANGAIHS
jgi:hypothetical protein